MSRMIPFTNRRDFLKTLAFSAGGCALGSYIVLPKSAFAKMSEGYLDKIPMETRWAITSGGFVFFAISEDKALFDKVGKEKYNEIKFKKGLASGARNKKQAENFGFTGNDAESTAAMAIALVTMYYGPTEKFEMVNGTGEKAQVRNIKCAYWDTLQSQKITDDICSSWSQSWWEGFVTVMNPNLSLKLVKARPWGDPFCEWVIEHKA